MTIEEDREVLQELATSQELTSLLKERVNTLELRLASVLNDSADAPTTGDAPEMAICTLAHQVRTSRYDTEATINAVESLIERLQI